MKTQEKDIYHGAALTQIVEHPYFKALNKADSLYGHYLINKGKFIFVKYRKKKKSPWVFTFNPRHVSAIMEDVDSPKAKAFLVLVCGQETVCIFDQHQIKELLGRNVKGTQTITVKFSQGRSLRVSSSGGELKRTIPHNAFPNLIFR